MTNVGTYLVRTNTCSPVDDWLMKINSWDSWMWIITQIMVSEVLIHSDYVHLFIFDSCLFLLEYHGDLIHPELDETGCLPQFNILFRLKNGVMIWVQRYFTIFWYIVWMDFEWIETTSRESMAADLGIQGWTGLWGGRNHGLAAASWVPYPYRCPQTWLDSFLSVASRVFREPIILGYM